MTSIRSILLDLRTSFDAGGIEAVAKTHRAAVQTHFAYRMLSGLTNLLVPVNALLRIAEDADRQVGHLGVARGTQEVLKRLPAPCQVDFPERGREIIQSQPLVVFGKHGSVLTPFIIAASLDRSDLRMLTASYVAKIGPNTSAASFPVYLPPPTIRHSGRGGILPRVIGWLTSRLVPPMEKSEAQERNRAALRNAANHVRDGGTLLIAPDGRDSKAKWQKGIGLLVAQLAESESWLVPYRIWTSNTAVFRMFSCNPILRALAVHHYRRGIRVAFAEPISVASVIEKTGRDAVAITAHLEAHYRSLGF